jgi:hypothetical protein
VVDETYNPTGHYNQGADQRPGDISNINSFQNVFHTVDILICVRKRISYK